MLTVTYIVTSQVDFIHALWCRNEEFDTELLACYIDIRSNLTA